MADPLLQYESYLSAFMRVQRGVETAQDLITAFSALVQAALDSSSAGGSAGPVLTEQDRRRLLDYPDAEEEAVNIRHVSSRSRAELVSTTLSCPGDLSDAELELETGTTVAGRSNVTPVVRELVAEARQAAELTPRESLAGITASSELFRRRKRRDDVHTAVALSASQRHTTPAWMHDLARQFQDEHINSWGFIALYDFEAQETMSTEDRDRFERTVEDVLQAAMINNGPRASAIARRWRLHFFDAPRLVSTTDISAATTGSSFSADEQMGDYGTTLRNAFRTVLDSAEWLNISQFDQGLRTDVFLVVNKECISSVSGRYLDDMRIAAHKASFTPVDRSSYANGYEGWTWVRLEQLVYRFYGIAYTRNDVNMYDIWRAALASKHNAFVSLDPEVAQGWTMSTGMKGQWQPRYDVHF